MSEGDEKDGVAGEEGDRQKKQQCQTLRTLRDRGIPTEPSPGIPATLQPTSAASPLGLEWALRVIFQDFSKSTCS